MSLRDRVSDAIWEVMHGVNGRLLSGDFYPGHDAIVDAVMNTLPPTVEVFAQPPHTVGKED